MESEFKEIEHCFDPEFYERKMRPLVERLLESYFGEQIYSLHKCLDGLEGLLKDDSVSKIITATHSTHMEYLEIPYAWYTKGLKPLSIAAGDNLFVKVPFIGDFDEMIRKSKGYKIIRNPSENKTYETTKQLLNYTKKLLENKEDILVFPERKRSYTGELLEFSPAVINLFIHASRKAGRKIAFIPINNCHERIPEDMIFPVLNKLNKKNFIDKIRYYISDWPFIYANAFVMRWKKQKPKITINVGKPLYPEEYEMNPKMIASELQKRCGELQEVFPTNAMCHSFGNKTEMEKTEMWERIAELIEKFRAKKARISNLRSPKEICERVVELFSRFWLTPKLEWMLTPAAAIEKAKNKYALSYPAIAKYYSKKIQHLL